MFTVGRNLFLLAPGKPSAKGGLIIPNHRLIFEQNAVNVAVYQLLFDDFKIGAKRRLFGGICLGERVGGTCATEA